MILLVNSYTNSHLNYSSLKSLLTKSTRKRNSLKLLDSLKLERLFHQTFKALKRNGDLKRFSDIVSVYFFK